MPALRRGVIITRYTPQWLQAGVYPASLDRRLIGALWPAGATSGLAITGSATMNVNIAAGQCAVPSQNNSGSTLCTSDAVEVVTLAAAPGSGTNRIDLIICRPRGNDLDGGANTDFIFDMVTGTAAATPTVPAVPAGTVALAQIYVPGGSASVTAGNITDVRPGGLALSSSTGPASSPRGTLAQAIATANSSATTTNVDWFAAPAFTVDGTRRVKVTFTGWVNGTAADLAGLRLMEGSTVLQQGQVRIQATGGPGQTNITSFWQGVPAAGTHTYKLNLSLGGGTGVTGIATAVQPAVLLIEDAGT